MDRHDLKLPLIPPDLPLSSFEDDASGSWHADYELTLNEAQSVTVVVSEEELPALVRQQRAAWEAAGRPGTFDRSRARREAADTIAVHKLLNALKYLPVK